MNTVITHPEQAADQHTQPAEKKEGHIKHMERAAAAPGQHAVEPQKHIEKEEELNDIVDMEQAVDPHTQPVKEEDDDDEQYVCDVKQAANQQHTKEENDETQSPSSNTSSLVLQSGVKYEKTESEEGVCAAGQLQENIRDGGTKRISSSESEEENGLCTPPVARQASQRPHFGRSVLPLPMRMRAEKPWPTSLNAAPTPPNSAIKKGSQSVATPMELEILTQLEVLKQQQQQILIHLQRLSNVGGICSTDFSQLEIDLALPLADIDSLTKLENKLRLNQDLRKKLISFFCVIGGMTVKETVWRILKRLLTNTLSKQINWKGVNGKHSFSATILRQIINNSVRKNTFCSKATDVEVEKYVKRWLQLAGDRDGGRKDRNTRVDKNP